MSRHVSQATKPIPMPETAVHPLEPRSQPAPLWLGRVGWFVFELAAVLVVATVVLLAL